MFKINLDKKLGSVFVTFIGIALILFSLVQISIGLFGEKDTAIITNIRRQGGERNESVPNRYTYAISYSFTLPNGKKIDGFTYKIGNAVYVKVSDSSISMIPVRYLKALPQINALDSTTGFKIGNLVLIVAGIGLIKFVSPPKRGHKIKNVKGRTY